MKEEITSLFETVQRTAGLTGGAAILLKDGNAETVFFGLSDDATGLPVSDKTYFDIASCTKSFTAMTGALAAADGYFDFDRPAVEYMKDFAVADAHLSANITPRDMLSHRTGLPRHDFIDNLKIADRAELCRHYRYLEATCPLRTHFQYSNQMYVYFGYFLEKATGMTYEQWLMDRLAATAGIGIRVRSVPNCMQGLEHAKPYRTNGHSAMPCEYSLCPAEAPDGSVRARIGDLGKWIQLMSCNGAIDGKQICPPAQFAQLITPTMTVSPAAPGTPEMSYGLGWRISQRGGKKVCVHAGDLKGFNAKMGFLPGENSGFAVVVNTNGTGAETLIGEYMLDQLCGTHMLDIEKHMQEWRTARDGYDATRMQLLSMPTLDKKQAEPLYGEYESPCYGTCVVAPNADGPMLTHGVKQYLLKENGAEPLAVWRYHLVPEDYSAIRLRKDTDALLIQTGDSSLWHRFQKKH